MAAMIRFVAIILSSSALSACIYIHQVPLPSNGAIATQYPKAANGDQQAIMGMATSFQNGYGGVSANKAESLRYWLNLAETDNFRAQLALGAYYQSTDREQAAYWYKRVAETGNKFALAELARLYANARNGTPNFQIALKWAYAADNLSLISQYQKLLTPVAQAEARRQADDWKNAHPAKDPR